jgi:hypothetical protein
VCEGGEGEGVGKVVEQQLGALGNPCSSFSSPSFLLCIRRGFDKNLSSGSAVQCPILILLLILRLIQQQQNRGHRPFCASFYFFKSSSSCKTRRYTHLALRICCTYFFEVANKDCKDVEKITKKFQIFSRLFPKDIGTRKVVQPFL